jgi:hypothetical protein
VYAFGRRIPRLVQTGISLQMQVPGVRRLFSERHAAVEPVCGADIWHQIAEIVRQRNKTLSCEWLHFSSQWDKQRSSFLALNVMRDPELFLTIESEENRSLSPSMPGTSYRVPLCRHSFVHAGWSVREDLVPLEPSRRQSRSALASRLGERGVGATARRLPSLRRRILLASVERPCSYCHQGEVSSRCRIRWRVTRSCDILAVPPQFLPTGRAKLASSKSETLLGRRGNGLHYVCWRAVNTSTRCRNAPRAS